MKAYHEYKKVADGNRVKCVCCVRVKRSKAKRLVNRHVRRATRQELATR